MKKPIWLLAKMLTFFIAILLTACASHRESLSKIDTTNLAELEDIRTYPHSPSDSRVELGLLRKKLLQDTGMSLGAQGGLAWASTKMNAKMNEDRIYLDTIFNFNAMMLSHGVIPPVLEEGDYSLNLDHPDTIRVADRTYKIVHQARFATTAPNWREYLWFNFPKPTLPDKTLLPRTAEEQKVWAKSVAMGWDKGMEQAYNIFQQNLARLKRDYRGMILYRKLLQQKMISPPFVSRTELGVTGDGDDMRVNDQVLRIVEMPKLQVNSKHWRAVVVRSS